MGAPTCLGEQARYLIVRQLINELMKLDAIYRHAMSVERWAVLQAITRGPGLTAARRRSAGSLAGLELGEALLGVGDEGLVSLDQLLPIHLIGGLSFECSPERCLAPLVEHLFDELAL
ncbi:MAG: hypothetical protein KDB51_12210, partial [Propionibacteriaceae bacterium]|nr:hypothetical protein [Propionibacteriaceae bacterium]